MTEVNSFADVHRILAGYSPSLGDPDQIYTLDRMRQFAADIGNPQYGLKIVHIAGTSGKTSTSYYIASLLQQAGHTVGLSVSPHIVEINERIQVNLLPLPEAEFCALFAEFLAVVEQATVRPTYFELMIGLAYWYFKKIGVDYAVMETGLGGLYDATNVADQPDKICVITDIGIDHTRFLGETIPEIAANKAGIIHSGNTVLMHRQPPEVMQVFMDKVRMVDAELMIIEPQRDNLVFRPDITNGLPDFQRRNWQLAYETYERVCGYAGIEPLSDEQLIKTTKTYIPGRMEYAHYGDMEIIIDGAHNPQKLAAFAGSMRQRYPDASIAALVSFVHSTTDEKLVQNAAVVAGLCDRIIVVPFQTGQDKPQQSLGLTSMQNALQSAGAQDVMTAQTIIDGLDMLARAPGGIKVVTGSLYFAGMVKRLLQAA